MKSDYGSVRILEGEEELINKKEGTTMTATPATPSTSSTTQRKTEEGITVGWKGMSKRNTLISSTNWLI